MIGEVLLPRNILEAAANDGKRIGVPKHLIFCAADGSHLQPNLVSQVMVRRMRKTGIKEGSLHMLRHSHASNPFANGVSLPAEEQRADDVWDGVIDGPVQ